MPTLCTYVIAIQRLSESSIAPFLTALQHRVKLEGIRVGSYPAFQRGVTISLLGRDVERVKALGDEVRQLGIPNALHVIALIDDL